MNPFTQRVSNLLPNQVHKKAIEVDAHLRVKGAPEGDVYAIGDCATVSYPAALGIGFWCGRLIWVFVGEWKCRSRRRLLAICWS